MGSTVTLEADTLDGMAKSKPNGDKRKTARVNVGVPDEWHAVARRLAALGKQPVVYLLIDLLAEAAKKRNITDLPPVPWDEGRAEA